MGKTQNALLGGVWGVIYLALLGLFAYYAELFRQGVRVDFRGDPVFVTSPASPVIPTLGIVLLAVATVFVLSRARLPGVALAWFSGVLLAASVYGLLVAPVSGASVDTSWGLGLVSAAFTYGVVATATPLSAVLAASLAFLVRRSRQVESPASMAVGAQSDT
ncbi:hypothetical protein [Cellulomonas dongxiuzhuiae]|uniref:hypothetical protein n=1 Tax=Cellulomonas dongxiuzhuiae TaxID=2819979 RepID=UPI001AAF5920|nr:hypothetical protein [Cellulomonas dongxiuzhuiae]MBO3089491.1 hypothetical protein [Cellulomonas dongxiuzhuiae]